MKHRSRNDIIFEILKTSVNGKSKTNIMYEAFISFNQLKEYLDFMLGKRLLEYTPGNRLYFTTAKGKEFLRMYEDIEGMMKKSDMLDH